jgi:hypothetical protein
MAEAVGSAAISSFWPNPLGLVLADVGSRAVEVSADEAGYGWFVGPTPLRDEEFRAGAPGSPLTALPGTAASGRMGLLTVVPHEMGHLAGRDDVATPGHADGLMADTLALGPAGSMPSTQFSPAGCSPARRNKPLEEPCDRSLVLVLSAGRITRQE